MATATEWKSNEPLQNANTPYAKERVKHEMDRGWWGEPGRPRAAVGFQEYPMMVKKAGPPPGGLGAIEIVDEIIVESERERAAKEHEGYYATAAEAIDRYNAMILGHSKLAANLDWQKQHGLSDKAVAEVEAAQNAHAGHLPSVPVTPIRPRAKKDGE